MDTLAPSVEQSVIAPTAIVAKTAKIGRNVRIGHYAIVEDHAEIGDGCILNAHAMVKRFSILKENVLVDSFAIVGGDNQDRKFDPKTTSGVIVGANTQVREGVTIHRAGHEGEYTRVGANCLLMGNSHVAHDCNLGDNVILANSVLLAGHITAHSNCILGGGAVFHQFIRIGELAMVSGNAAMSYDVPPFVMALERNQIKGLNIIGLRRAGYSSSDVQDLKKLYHLILAARGNPVELAEQVRKEGEYGHSRAGQIFLKFFEEESLRGFVRPF